MKGIKIISCNKINSKEIKNILVFLVRNGYIFFIINFENCNLEKKDRKFKELILCKYILKFGVNGLFLKNYKI